jgi:hypothetical protein
MRAREADAKIELDREEAQFTLRRRLRNLARRLKPIYSDNAPERYSRQGAREFDVQSSLPLQRDSEGPKSGGNSRGIRLARQSIKVLLYK